MMGQVMQAGAMGFISKPFIDFESFWINCAKSFRALLEGQLPAFARHLV